jgi:hypothetical protein
MSRSTAIDLVCILKICVRDSKSGNPNSTFRSRRPGLKSAGSKVSGLIVERKVSVLYGQSVGGMW